MERRLSELPWYPALRVGAGTVTVNAGEVMAFTVAVRSDVPGLMALTKPLELIIALAGVALTQDDTTLPCESAPLPHICVVAAGLV